MAHFKTLQTNIQLNELRNSSSGDMCESTRRHSPEDSHNAQYLWSHSKGEVMDSFQCHETRNPSDTHGCLSLQRCVTLHLIFGSCLKRKEKVELERKLFDHIQMELNSVTTS